MQSALRGVVTRRYSKCGRATRESLAVGTCPLSRTRERVYGLSRGPRERVFLVNAPLSSKASESPALYLACSRQPGASAFVSPSGAHLISSTGKRETCWYSASPSLRAGASLRPRVRRRTRGIATMERPTGQFQRLAKPKFDKENPNAVLGEVKVPGLEQICLCAQTQLFPKREVVQMVKDLVQRWCDEENGRERANASRNGGMSSEDRAVRTWRAYEFIALPARNRTLDSEVLGMTVGLAPNDTKIEVVVDYGKEVEAPEVGSRLLDMVAEVSREINEVFGYEDNAAAGGDKLGPWKKGGQVNSWRKWLHIDSGEPLPESAVAAFRTVQANWASPRKIAGAMNFTVSWSQSRMEESRLHPEKPLRSVEVFHSALHPHVLKIVEHFVSPDAMLDFSHRCYVDFLEGVFDFRAAVNPTVQAYTPLRASVRPCMSARLSTGAMVPLVAMGGSEAGVAPLPEIIYEGLKIGLRHVVLEVGSAGVEDAVKVLAGALTFGIVKRRDLFVTLLMGEDRAQAQGGDGIAAAIREVLAYGRERGGNIDEGADEGQQLEYVDALVLLTGSGSFAHDGNDAGFSAAWDEARAGAIIKNSKSARAGSDAPKPLAKHLGVGGHGPGIVERLPRLLNACTAQRVETPGHERLDVLPPFFFGDLRAGDGASTAKAVEFCRDAGVQTFSLTYVGGAGGEEALKGADAAAEYEWESVTGEEVLAKWVMEIGGGVLWRPRGKSDVWRTLPLARYFLAPEWITEIVDRGGCPPEAWKRTLSRLLPPEGMPSEDELEAEADAILGNLAGSDD